MTHKKTKKDKIKIGKKETIPAVAPSLPLSLSLSFFPLLFVTFLEFGGNRLGGGGMVGRGAAA